MQFGYLGQNIRKHRMEKNLTQQDFASLLHIAPQTISKWERGSSCPDIFYLQKICKILDISILDILQVDEELEKDNYYIAIDGGGTKTDLVLFKSNGEVVLTVTDGTTNPNSCGIKSALSTLKKGIDHLLVSPQTPKRIFAGIAGTGVDNHKETIRQFLKKSYPFCEVNVDSDIKNTIGLSRENKKCIAAIMGTGSVVFGWNGKDLKRVGGWGYLLGDEGSGYDIGREVLVALCAYKDGLSPYSEVVRLAENMLGDNQNNYISKVYREGRSYIASFCPIAFEALALGDKLAEEIISKSASSLAKLINHMYRAGEYGNHVIVSGGLAMNGEIMNKMIEKELDPGVVVEFSNYPPILGAMRTCLELDGVTVDYDALKHEFNETYTNKNL